VYDSTLDPLPGNVVSQPYQTQQTAEFGDHVAAAQTGGIFDDATITMSNWAKHSTYPTLPDEVFTHPITLNLYGVDNSGSVPALGAVIATTTQDIVIPWRPEAAGATECPSNPAGWKAPSGQCFSGMATNITFDLAALNIAVPSEFIWGVAFNTNTYGANPIGQPGPYESLNVGLVSDESAVPTVGTDVEEDAVFWDTETDSYYADGGDGAGVNAFRRDTVWTGYIPMAQFTSTSTSLTTEWMGQEWDYQLIGTGTNVSTTIDPVTDYITLTRTGGTGDISLHVNRLLDGNGNDTLNDNRTPWVKIVYEDNNQSRGVDLFIDDEKVALNSRIQAGSLFTCDGFGYVRYGPSAEEIVFVDGCGDRSAGEVHELYVGKRADGTVDYRFDGVWSSSTFLTDNGAGDFDFNDVYLRLRAASSGPASTHATFRSFEFGDDHNPDTTAPELTVPDDQNATATGPSGAVVTYTATATDTEDSNVDVVCAPASGSTFAIGTTTVTCTATNDFGLTDTDSFDVIVSENDNVATQVEVFQNPSNGWTLFNQNTATAELAVGPTGAPLGEGSLELAVGADGDDAAQARNTDFAGTRLADLTHLSYSTFVSDDGSGGQMPYLIVNIDQDGNGSVDDRLFFEPVYQNGTYSGDSIPNQCGTAPNCVALNEWKSWNALVGGWWSLNDATFGPPLKTLATYISENPDAEIVNTSATEGGVRLVAGGGAGAWDNFVGNVDAFRINDTVYNFDGDNVAPTTTATISPAANDDDWNRYPVNVGRNATDDRSGVASISRSLSDGTTTYGPLVSANDSTNVRIEDEGIWTVSFAATDEAGNTEVPKEVVVKLDRTKPTTTAPVASFGTSGITFDGYSYVTLDWTGTDNLSGVSEFTLQRRINGRKFLTIATLPSTTTTQTMLLPHGKSFAFRVRAIDTAGNFGNYATAAAFTLHGDANQEVSDVSAGSVVYGGTWIKQTSARFFGGTTRYSSASFRTATYTFTGTNVAWISSTGPGRGRADVTVTDMNGDVVASDLVDLYTVGNRKQQVVFVVDGLAQGTYEVEIAVRGSGSGNGSRVDIDGFLVLEP